MSLSGAGRRRKGVVGEREVKEIFAAWGFTVRGLEGLGDHMATKRGREGLIAFHLEVKRQERLRVPEWMAQAEAESPDGFIPLLCYRRSNEKWHAVLGLGDLLGLIK
jgi:hypothetical protein